MPARRLQGRPVVIVDGCRTPFARSQTVFSDSSSYELGRMAVAGLLQRQKFDTSLVDLVVFGTVLADPATSNLAREVGLASGLPQSTAAFTVSAACASSNVAIAQAATNIATGQAEIVIAGGAEVLSDPPIRVKRPIRKRLVAMQKARGFGDYLGLLKGLAPADLLPEVPAIAEFSTGLSMGQTAERLAARVGISRADQDAFAVQSHAAASIAARKGLLDDQIIPAYPRPSFKPVASDNGVRPDTSIEKLSKLPPAFDRRFGTVTAGNSSFLTDGAAACVVMNEDRARELGVEGLARIVATSTCAMDPLEELLLGPAFAIPDVLDAAGIELADVEVIEIHEAFAAQVLACVRLLADAEFCRDRLGREEAVGEIAPERLNAWGGSLSIGHPFGATGARLITTCARRMKSQNARYGLVATCAAGAIGNAFLLERC